MPDLQSSDSGFESDFDSSTILVGRQLVPSYQLRFEIMLCYICFFFVCVII